MQGLVERVTNVCVHICICIDMFMFILRVIFE